MTIRKILLATATLMLLHGTASAQPSWAPPGNDPDGYYSPSDHNGYYDHNGTYRHIRQPDYGPPPPPPPPADYRTGDNGPDCHRGNAVAGTVFGALAGGLIGGAASHGNGGAVVGGAILGGLFGNVVGGDIDCDDQPYAFRVYADGLNGDLNRRYDWRHGNSYGYFTPLREFRRGRLVCRDFTETTYRHGRNFTRTGTACRQADGNWRFD